VCKQPNHRPGAKKLSDGLALFGATHCSPVVAQLRHLIEHGFGHVGSESIPGQVGSGLSSHPRTHRQHAERAFDEFRDANEHTFSLLDGSGPRRIVRFNFSFENIQWDKRLLHGLPETFCLPLAFFSHQRHVGVMALRYSKPASYG
jgi:hypothetical protein